MRGVAIFAIGAFVSVSACTTQNPYGDRVSDYITDRAKKNVIVFVHGVTGNFHETWLNRETDAYWPTLLGQDQDFKDFAVYVVKYSSPTLRRVSTIEEIVSRELQRFDNAGLFKHERIYFVAHSMGGLITKRMLVVLNRSNPDAMDKLDRVRGVFFLSTPAQGSQLADILSSISSNHQFGDMKPADINSYLQSLENGWQNLMEDRDKLLLEFPKSFCAYETQPTRGVLVVNRIYAATRCDGNPYLIDLGHSGMASPRDRQSDPYPWVKSLILQTEAGPQSESRAKLNSRSQTTQLHSVIPDRERTGDLVRKMMDQGMLNKGGEYFLHKEILPRLKKGEKFPILVFDVDRDRNYYTGDTITEYINQLNRFETFQYVAFLLKGKYLGWTTSGRFQYVLQQHGPQTVADWLNHEDLATLLTEGQLRSDKMNGAVTVTQAVDWFKSNRLQQLAVIDDRERLEGIVSLSGMVMQLSLQQPSEQSR